MDDERVTVSGEMTVRWTVRLPADRARDGQACDDPAVECAMGAIFPDLTVLLWGKDAPGAHVYLEVCEEDVTVEEDER